MRQLKPLEFYQPITPKERIRTMTEENQKSCIDVKGMVKYYLDLHGFGGLVNPGICGCESSDLFPCDELDDCKAAYKHSPAPCKDCDSECDGYDEDGRNFCMRLEKPSIKPGGTEK